MRRTGPVRTLGLTGGIGSGKSEVARVLASLGARVIDTDAISRALTQAGGAAIEPIRTRFGSDVIDASGALDRAAMRQLAFSDPQNRMVLESILHPLISDEARRQAEAAAAGQVVVFDVPLLVESGRRWIDRVDRVLVVDCSNETQIQRVMQRSGWSRDTVERVIGQQAAREARRAVADAVILNDGIDLPALREAVIAVWKDWGLPV